MYARSALVAATALLVSRPRLCLQEDGPTVPPAVVGPLPDPADYDDETLLLGSPRRSAAFPEPDDDDEELIGEARSWPFGAPTLRTAAHLGQIPDDERPPAEGPTIAELRVRRSAAADAAEAEREELLRSAGLSSASEVQRVLRNAPYLNLVEPAALAERLDALHAALPAQHARVKVLVGASSLLLHENLPETLPRKLRELEAIVGLPEERVAAAAPSLLMLDARGLEARLRGLREALPELCTEEVLRRAPRLLSCKPSRLRGAWELLAAELPREADLAAIFQAQPTLLATSLGTLRPKLRDLEELCTPSEWRALVGSPGSFARVLTASRALITERLRAEPEVSADGSPRRVKHLLLMSRAEYERGRPTGRGYTRHGGQPSRTAAGRRRGAARTTRA